MRGRGRFWGVYVEFQRGPKPLDRSATALAGIPEPPASLCAVARTCWEQTAALMLDAGTISLLDATALELFSTLYARWVEASEQSRGTNAVITAPNGYQQKNPWYEIAASTQKDIKYYLNQFGLTPAARAKLKLEPPEDEDTKFAEFE